MYIVWGLEHTLHVRDIYTCGRKIICRYVVCHGCGLLLRMHGGWVLGGRGLPSALHIM